MGESYDALLVSWGFQLKQLILAESVWCVRVHVCMQCCTQRTTKVCKYEQRVKWMRALYSTSLDLIPQECGTNQNLENNFFFPLK